MKAIGIIPARMGSTRFPGKPLAPLRGFPLLEHVYLRSAMCKSLHEVVIATCDREIADAAVSWGARAIMTSKKHTRASDRTAEAAKKLSADVFVMIQGDEPLVHPNMIEASLQPMRKDSSVACVNLAAPILSKKEHDDPNTIKVVSDRDGDALYMSRAPIPNSLHGSTKAAGLWKQVCIIPFRKSALERYTRLHPTPLEIAESIDMMRFIENKISVRMVPIKAATQAVDTPADLRKVARMLSKDPLFQRYRGLR